MSDLREQFEAIPEISVKLTYVWFNSDTGRYCDNGKHPNANGQFLNGAWFMFQELNK